MPAHQTSITRSREETFSSASAFNRRALRNLAIFSVSPNATTKFRAKRSAAFLSEAKNPGFADALSYGTTGVRGGRSMVEGAVVCAEKDPGFFAALRMTQRKRRNPESRRSAVI